MKDNNFESCLQYVEERYINPMLDWEVQFVQDCYDLKVNAEDAECSLSTMVIWTLVTAWRVENLNDEN